MPSRGSDSANFPAVAPTNSVAPKGGASCAVSDRRTPSKQNTFKTKQTMQTTIIIEGQMGIGPMRIGSLLTFDGQAGVVIEADELDHYTDAWLRRIEFCPRVVDPHRAHLRRGAQGSTAGKLLCRSPIHIHAHLGRAQHLPCKARQQPTHHHYPPKETQIKMKVEQITREFVWKGTEFARPQSHRRPECRARRPVAYTSRDCQRRH